MSDIGNSFRKLSKKNKVILASVLGSVLFLSTLTPVLNIPILPSGIILLPSAIAADDKGKKGDNNNDNKGKKKFHLEEASISDIHKAIQSKEITCQGLVQAYINRAAAYNGVCTQLITEDGAPIPPATGYVRAGAPIEFPTDTVAVSSLLPDYDDYVGLPIDLGRMEATASDPSVQQQFGMIVGIPDAGQINALGTFNIRGERSVTCKGAFDAHPSTGPLPEGAPEVCEEFRQQPDALERAAELDAQYGNNPDLKNLPMYCIPFSIKDPWDTKDMRSTSGADVNYAMDAAPEDSTNVAELRAKGAIIYAKANAADYHGDGRGPGGAATAASVYLGPEGPSTWAGTTCNPYDTTREPGRSSTGGGASTAANLAVCSICESTGGSCRNAGSNTAVVTFVPAKGILSFGGVHPATAWRDHPGIFCRTVEDTTLVLDALKNPVLGYFDPRDIYTAWSSASISEEPYASFVLDDQDLKKDNKPLEGMRIALVREHMVKPTLNDVAASDQINNEVKTILRDKLGAELVESVDPLYPDDPDIPNMEYTFQDALAEILPLHMPEYLSKTTSSGALEFAVPGWDVTTRDYMAAAAAGLAPWPDNLNLRRITSSPQDFSFSLTIAEYLLERGDTRVYDWATLNDNSKHHADFRRAAMENWENKVDVRSDGITELVKMRYVMTLMVNKVMEQNDIDVFVHGRTTLTIPKIGGPNDPGIPNARQGSWTNIGRLSAITVPAGYNDIIYEPQFVLSADKKSYTQVTGIEKSLLDHPQPIGIMFVAGPGEEPTLIKVASAYEAATHHRIPPPDFGPLPEEP
jgi:Asp-tRNA(Asn)/Glu-tRNA(Gln) amidotransferase A subunit family amidase